MFFCQVDRLALADSGAGDQGYAWPESLGFPAGHRIDQTRLGINPSSLLLAHGTVGGEGLWLPEWEEPRLWLAGLGREPRQKGWLALTSSNNIFWHWCYYQGRNSLWVLGRSTHLLALWVGMRLQSWHSSVFKIGL